MANPYFHYKFTIIVCFQVAWCIFASIINNSSMKKKRAKWDVGILNCFPEGARDTVKAICERDNLNLRFCSSIMTNYCLGLWSYHNIYIDIGLDRFTFLIIFAHELAHYEMYKKYRRRETKTHPKCHGKEFQNMFETLIEPFLIEKIYPPDVLVEVKKWIKRGDLGWEGYPFIRIAMYCDYRKLEDLPDGTHFKTRGCGYIKVRYDEASGKYLCYADYGWVLYDPNEKVVVL